MGNIRVQRPEELKRSAQISVAVTPDQKRRIIEAAHGSGRVVAQFMRESAMSEVERVEQELERAAGKGDK